MKTVKNLSELHKTALARGAEVVGGGQHFNSGRARAQRQASQAIVETPAPKGMLLDFNPPAQPPLETLTRTQVEQMLAAHNMRVSEQFAAIIAALKQAPPTPQSEAVREWDFTVTYDSHHAITNVNAKARP